ncbi:MULTISPECIES: mechanosensitive ion channel family protein [unclassified Marinitoga]|uniref:mechanosensitive ion channel family protein n=1 Tax=unclassified Marinitoga TaxID=2640159 RepID=UPI0006410608|nr:MULTISPECIES: mechanosensitive ion channel family protein [unclassified Marinitoga]KLO21439.1 small mechanosensitive ion channel protein MscS [Marinitoga sp. 1155]NUU99779.1 mechanosensitive ion channel protein MscS [Marinitoga sp. 1154]
MNIDMNIIVDYSLRIGISIIVLILTKFFSKITYKSMMKITEKTGRSIAYKNTSKVLINIFYYTLGGFIILSLLFKDFMPFLTGLGISGVIVAFAIQEPLSNFICGILLMFSKTIKEGDAIEVNGISGSVDQIDLNHTVIKTFDGKLVRIPNKTMWNSSITNYWPSNIRRSEINLGVSYNTDLTKFFGLINEYLKTSHLIYQDNDHKPFIWFSGFNDSSIDFSIKFWLKKDDYFEGTKKIATEIFELLKLNNIEIPFTQIDINIKRG